VLEENARVYPGSDLLEEVGRVTIAGSRLDLQLGQLWHHLDRAASFETARSKPGAQQSEKVRRLVDERLVGDLAVEAQPPQGDHAHHRR
jgi:hypothetical protein